MESKLAPFNSETEQGPIAQALQYRLAFEKLLTTISTYFLNLPPHRIDQGIQYSLQTIGEFAEVDRSYLFLYQDDEISNIYEWCAPGIPPQIHRLEGLSLNRLGWHTQDSHIIEYIHLPFSTENHGGQDPTITKEVKSLLIVPLLYRETLKGFLGFDSIRSQRNWADEDISLLKVVGEILINALERHKSEEREKLAYDLGQELASLIDVRSLLSLTVHQLQDTFHYYHSQVYLLNKLSITGVPATTTEYLILCEGTGEIGQQLKTQQHKLSMDAEPSLVVRAAHLREVVVANDALQNPHHLSNPLLPDTRSEIAIPLVAEQQLIGVLDIQHTAPNHFSHEEIRILQLIANQLSVALSKAELFDRHQRLLEETRRRVDELAVLHAVAAASARATDEDELIEAVTRIIGETLYPMNFGVLLLDPATGSLRTHPSYHGKNIPLSLGQGVVGRVAATGQPRRVADVSKEPGYLNVDIQTRSELCVPLKIGDQVIGVVNTESDRLDAFSEADERSLITFAQQLATGMQKIRFLADTMKALYREQGLNEITRALNSAPDLPSILASVIRMSAELLKADVGLLGLLLDNQVMSFYPYNVPFHISLRPLPKGRGVAWYIVETGEGYLLEDYAEHPQAEQKWIRLGVKSALGVPLVAGETMLGALELFSLIPEKQFNQRDRALAESIGRQAGTVLQNRRLYTEVQQRANMLATTLSKQEELDRAKNLFIQNVSHELRTPLGIIYGHAELLESGGLGELQSMQQQSVQIITRRARMLTDLVEDLSALLAAETQEFRRESIDPSLLVNSMYVEFQMKAQETNINLQTEIQDKLPWILGDPTHLRRVFDNLVSNAFKFTPAGGSVTLRMYPEGKDLIIEVADTGKGIPQDKLHRIFERFYQVDDEPKHRRQGTGLGLALVKEIVEAHRGQVTVQSKVGEGTTFQIWLPGHEPVASNQ